MGWATYLTTTIEFNRATYNSLYEVEDDIQEAKEDIKRCREELLMIAAVSDIKSLCEDDEDPIYTIRNRVDEILECYDNACVELYKLTELKEAWEESHDPSTGLAIDRKISLDGKESNDYNYLEHPLVSGDFVKGTHKDDEDEDTELSETLEKDDNEVHAVSIKI